MKRLISIILALALVVNVFHAGELDTRLILFAEDHYAHRIPGAAVEITQGSITTSYSADSEGAVLNVPVNSEEEIIIDLGSAPGRDGTVIPQRYRHTPLPPPSNAESYYNVGTFYQPLALTEFVDENTPAYSPYGADWRLYPATPQSSYAFGADIGVFLFPEQLNAYADYYDTSLPRDYEAGLLIRNYVPADLGVHGIAAAIDISHTSIGGGSVVVDSAHFAPEQRHFGTSSATASVMSVNDGILTFSITGELATGDNLFLIDGRTAPPPEGPFDYAQYTKFNHPIASPPQATHTLASTCNIAPPDPLPSSPPPCIPSSPPAAWNSCGIPEPVGSPWVSQSIRPFGSSVCGMPIDSGTVTAHYKPIHTTIKGKIQAFFVEVEGEFGLPSEGYEFTPNFGDGEFGNGQCKQLFGQRAEVRQRYEVLVTLSASQPCKTVLFVYGPPCVVKATTVRSCEIP